MAEISNAKRIIAEDFATEDRELVEKLSYVLNNFMLEVVDAFNKNINFSNLNQDLVDVDVTVDSTGKPITPTNIKSSVANVQGMIVIRATNTKNGSIPPKSQPFLTFTPTGSGLYTINNVTGLQDVTKYKLKILVIGN